MTELEKALVQNRLVDLRKNLDLPQWKVALASGVKDSRLSQLENGLPPSPLDVQRLSVFFGVPASDIWPARKREESASNDEGE